MKPQNLHCHTHFCDGADSPAAMAAAAFAAGCGAIGFSGHSPLPGQEVWCMDPARVADYRRAVMELKTGYAGRMEVYLGLEQDFCSPDTGPDWDYKIGSVHCLPLPDGTLLPLDESAATLASGVRRWFGGDWNALARAYYERVARVDTVTGGEIVGLIGRNGAGKSTTIKCLTGFLPYEQGTIKICGYDIKTEAVKAKQELGYVPDNRAVFEQMTGTEYVNFIADLHKTPLNVRLERIEEMQEYNQQKMLAAFIHNGVSESHFVGSTGYGYDDRGRETLDAVFAMAMGAEDALVRHNFVSGTLEGSTDGWVKISIPSPTG